MSCVMNTYPQFFCTPHGESDFHKLETCSHQLIACEQIEQVFACCHFLVIIIDTIPFLTIYKGILVNQIHYGPFLLTFFSRILSYESWLETSN